MFHLQAACLVLGRKPFSYGQEGKFPGEKHKVKHKVCVMISQVQRTDTFFFFFGLEGSCCKALEVNIGCSW